MAKLLTRFLPVFLVAALLASCSDSDGGTPEPTPTAGPTDGVFETRGSSSFVYKKYAPLADKPVTVYYYIPTRGDVVQMPVLFSMHGSERDGTIQRDAWKYFAEEFGFVVISPQFTHENGYAENDYQFGGVFTATGSAVLRDREKWTYRIIEALFDYYKEETGSKAAKYNMFGHSAGGQFVHRYLLATPDARVNRAVAANPGSWTFPYPAGMMGTDQQLYGWPYSVKDTPFATDSHLKSFLAKKIWVQLGTADVDTADTSLPKDPPSNAQGAHRLERGRNFYAASKATASQMAVVCNFQLAEVAGVGHSTIRMVYGKSGSYDPKNVYNTGTNCAYDLIFK